jgi:peptide/nickel transport system permease protein
VSIAEIEERRLEESPPGSGLWSEAWRRLRQNKAALVGFGVIGLFVFVAVFAPLLAPYDPRETNLSLIQDGCCPGPSADHPLGVDPLVGGKLDTLIMRTMDIMLAIPGLLLAIGLVALLGQGLWQIMLAVGIVNVPIFTRLMRGSVLGQRDNDYVLAARTVGVPRRQILTAHVLPNSISPVIVQATLALATAIIDVAGLGFLGLGPQDPSTPEWGTMLTDTVRYLQSAPFLAIFPGIAIVVSVLGFNLVGDGLREALDPKLEGGR